jgi:hypothetical protein
MKVRLTDGSVVDLPKDCNCVTHEGPHALHMLEMDRQRLTSEAAEIERYAKLPMSPQAAAHLRLRMQRHAEKQLARLREKRLYMQANRISEILKL